MSRIQRLAAGYALCGGAYAANRRFLRTGSPVALALVYGLLWSGAYCFQDVYFEKYPQPPRDTAAGLRKDRDNAAWLSKP